MGVFTDIPAGTEVWDVPLNAALHAIDNEAASALNTAGAAVPKDTLRLNVKDHGVLGDGTTDDFTAIQALINTAAAIAGTEVYFPPGVYRTSNQITLKTGVTLRGTHATAWPGRFTTSLCSIRPTNTFLGECAISILGADITLSGTNEGNCAIYSLDLDGSALPAGSVSGIHAQGEAMSVVLRDVTVKNFTHNGIHTNIGTGTKAPHDWFMDSVVSFNNAGFGFSMSMTDGYMNNCIASTNGGDGYLMGPFGSLAMQGCQALFNTGNGFTTVGGTQVGNLTISSFVTDRNGHDGVHLGSSAGSGSGPIIISGLTCNRDGKNGNAGGGGYAGLAINGCANPVIIEGTVTNTGLDDDGSGVNSPQYGIRLSGNAYVAVGSGYFHGNITGWSDDGTNTVVRRGINVGEATGSKTAPTFVYTNGVTTVDGNLSAAGNALGLPRPKTSNNSAIAWTCDPVTINGSNAPVSGTLYLSAFFVDEARTSTKFNWGVQAAGTVPTAGQSFVGIYNSVGSLVTSVNVDARITGSNAVFTETISGALTPGMYWAAFLLNATTTPAIIGPAGLLTGATNFNATASTSRWAVNGTGLTALPGSITPSSNTTPAIARPFWAGIA
jgi:hypothetical protein